MPPTRREVIKTVVAVGAMPKAVGASRAGTTRPPPPPPMPATQLIVTPLAPLGPFVVGAPMSVTFTASPGVAPYVWSSTITPSWVTFTGSTSTATITGTVPSPANTLDSFVMAVNDHTTPTALTSPTGANFIITRTTNPQVFQPLRPILLSVVRTVPHSRAQLADCFGDFLIRIVCECGACREIEPQALARLVGWKITLEDLALRMRCSRCGNKGAEVIAVCTRIDWPMNRRLRARIAFQPSRGRGADVAACIDPH